MEDEQKKRRGESLSLSLSLSLTLSLSNIESKSKERNMLDKYSPFLNDSAKLRQRPRTADGSINGDVRRERK